MVRKQNCVIAYIETDDIYKDIAEILKQDFTLKIIN